MDYKRMYLILFDAIAKSIELLQQAHQQAEEIAMAQEDTPLVVLPPIDNEEQ